jgi:hypothetical protein
LNGILSGTPSIAGTSTFSVCAVDLAGQSACGTVTMTIEGTVTVGQFSYSCSLSASPLPGWKACPGTVALTISKPIQSGYVAVIIYYPSLGAWFRGELAINSAGLAQTVTVSLVNDYVPYCLATYESSVNVYDGRMALTQGQAPLLVSKPFTITSNC